jgi:hypothetical protein
VGGNAGSTASFILSADNLSAQDEDPTLLREQTDALSLAWYSNRNGLQADGREDKEIFLVRTTDDATWSAPMQLTRDATEWSFYPSLAQSQDGAVHLAWWRMTLTPIGCTPDVDCAGNQNNVMYSSAADWSAWNVDTSQAITSGPGDWLPSMVYDRVGDRLLVYFAAVARDAAGVITTGDSTLRIFVVIRQSNVWSAVTPLIGEVNAAGSHNTFPYVAQQSDGQFLMTWTRYDGSGGSGVLDLLGEPSAQTMLSTSSDGVTWSTPVEMSGTGLDVFPTLYEDHAGSWFLTWLTTAFAPGGNQVELAVGGTYPDGVVMRPEVAGYTGKIVATVTPGLFLAASVTGSTPTQKIDGRFFRK